MKSEGGVLGMIKARGEQLVTQVSNELMSNPQFMKVVQSGLRGKERLDEAVAATLKTMNVPTRSEYKKTVARVQALESQLAALRDEVAELKKRPAPAPVPRPTLKKKAAPRRAPVKKAAAPVDPQPE